jgi:hypothetical protein
MSTFYDLCLTRFISYAIAKERGHIEGGADFYELAHCHTASINKISSAIIPIYDDFDTTMNKVIKGEVRCEDDDTPWWMNPRKRNYGYSDKELYQLDDVILYQEKGHYYPVFHSFAVTEFKGGQFKTKELTGKVKMSACADFLKMTKKRVQNTRSSRTWWPPLPNSRKFYKQLAQKKAAWI